MHGKRTHKFTNKSHNFNANYYKEVVLPATSKRHLNDTKRRMSTRSVYQNTVARQGTTQADIQVSMMPDLSGAFTNKSYLSIVHSLFLHLGKIDFKNC